MVAQERIWPKVVLWWIGMFVLVAVQAVLGVHGFWPFVFGGAYGLVTAWMGLYALPFMYRW